MFQELLKMAFRLRERLLEVCSDDEVDSIADLVCGTIIIKLTALRASSSFRRGPMLLVPTIQKD